MYKLLKDNLTNQVRTDYILKKVEGDPADYFVPLFDENNTDYQAYLAWLAEGNTPEPADSE